MMTLMMILEGLQLRNAVYALVASFIHSLSRNYTVKNGVLTGMFIFDTPKGIKLLPRKPLMFFYKMWYSEVFKSFIIKLM